MNYYVHLNLPVTTINVAGNHCLYTVDQGVLVVQVLDHLRSKHSVQLPATIVPGLVRHLFSRGVAAMNGINMINAKSSY